MSLRTICAVVTDQVLQSLWHLLYKVPTFPLPSTHLAGLEEFFLDLPPRFSSLLNPADLESLKDAVQEDCIFIYIYLVYLSSTISQQVSSQTLQSIEELVFVKMNIKKTLGDMFLYKFLRVCFVSFTKLWIVHD